MAAFGRRHARVAHMRSVASSSLTEVADGLVACTHHSTQKCGHLLALEQAGNNNVGLQAHGEGAFFVFFPAALCLAICSRGPQAQSGRPSETNVRYARPETWRDPTTPGSAQQVNLGQVPPA